MQLLVRPVRHVIEHALRHNYLEGYRHGLVP